MLTMVKKIFGDDICKTAMVNNSDVLMSTGNDEYLCIRDGIGYTPLSFFKYLSVAEENDEILDTLISRNILFLNYGETKSGYILTEDGNVDAFISIYKNEKEFFIEVAEWDYDKVKTLLEDSGCQVNETELSCLLIEGPGSMKLFDEVFDIALEYMSYQNHEYFDYNGNDILIARTGYTGEFGYKVIAGQKEMEEVLTKLFQEKKDCLVGLDALKTCMLEVKQPDFLLSYLEYSKNIFEVDYQWLIDFKKDSDYRGKDALYQEVAAGVTKNTIGAACDAEVNIGDEVSFEDKVIGNVIDCRYSGKLGSYIAILLVEKAFAQSGVDFKVNDTNLHTISAPYIVPKSWTADKEES